MVVKRQQIVHQFCDPGQVSVPCATQDDTTVQGYCIDFSLHSTFPLPTWFIFQTTEAKKTLWGQVALEMVVKPSRPVTWVTIYPSQVKRSRATKRWWNVECARTEEDRSGQQWGGNARTAVSPAQTSYLFPRNAVVTSINFLHCS